MVHKSGICWFVVQLEFADLSGTDLKDVTITKFPWRQLFYLTSTMQLIFWYFLMSHKPGRNKIRDFEEILISDEESHRLSVSATKLFEYFSGNIKMWYVFSCEYCEIFRNTYFEEHLLTAAPDFLKQLQNIGKQPLLCWLFY